jgi:hypothetical protein
MSKILTTTEKPLRASSDVRFLNALARSFERHCAECGRDFDLTDEFDAAEWYAGHDCEA